MKGIPIRKFGKPTASDLSEHKLSARVSCQKKIIFIASFDMLRLHEQKTPNEISKFFNTNPTVIGRIIRMQAESLRKEDVFPDVFIDEEEEIVTNGEFKALKQTDLYQTLMNKNDQDLDKIEIDFIFNK